MIKKAIIIPGAQKSGTTTLYYILAQHSYIGMGRVKEPQFFSLDESTVNKNFLWYQQLFPNDKIPIDGSTFYLYSKRAPEFIRKYIFFPKILIVLRDPIKRAFSAYLHMYKKYQPCDKRSFIDIIDEIEGPEFSRIISTENQSIKRAIKRGQIKDDYLDKNYLTRKCNANFDSYFEDELFLYKYFQGSIYSDKVERYEKYFKNDVKIIIFEQMISNPESTLKQIYDFLDLKIEHESLKFHSSNRTKIPRGNKSREFIKIMHENPIFHSLITFFKKKEFGNRIIRHTKNMLLVDKPPLLKDYYWRARKILKFEYDYWFSRVGSYLEKFWTY